MYIYQTTVLVVEVHPLASSCRDSFPSTPTTLLQDVVPNSEYCIHTNVLCGPTVKYCCKGWKSEQGTSLELFQWTPEFPWAYKSQSRQQGFSLWLAGFSWAVLAVLSLFIKCWFSSLVPGLVLSFSSFFGSWKQTSYMWMVADIGRM